MTREGTLATRSDVLDFWEALHVQSLTRQLVAVFGSLEDALPELHDRVHGVRMFLADGLDEAHHADGARVLRDNGHIAIPERTPTPKGGTGEGDDGSRS